MDARFRTIMDAPHFKGSFSVWFLFIFVCRWARGLQDPISPVESLRGGGSSSGETTGVTDNFHEDGLGTSGDEEAANKRLGEGGAFLSTVEQVDADDASLQDVDAAEAREDVLGLNPGPPVDPMDVVGGIKQSQIASVAVNADASVDGSAGGGAAASSGTNVGVASRTNPGDHQSSLLDGVLGSVFSAAQPSPVPRSSSSDDGRVSGPSSGASSGAPPAVSAAQLDVKHWVETGSFPPQKSALLETSSTSEIISLDPAKSTELPSWLSTCKDTYLDIGSNIGVQVRKLFQPKLYGGNPAEPLFQTAFGGKDSEIRKSSCALGIEPNPTNHVRLTKVEQAYAKMGYKVHFLQAGLWGVPSSHKDMQMRFACMDQVHSCWGGKLLRENDAPPKNAVKLVRVPIVQASEIVKKILAAGSVIRLAKLDAEAAEWSIIPDLVQNNLLCKDKVEQVYIELHTPQRGFKVAEAFKNACKGCPPTLKGVEKLLKQQNCGTEGPTQILEVDDETFADDAKAGQKKFSIPLPKAAPSSASEGGSALNNGRDAKPADEA